MGKQGRRVRGRHANLEIKVTPLNEDDLFVALEKLEVPPMILILDQVQDPHNLGACLRTAEGAGVAAVVAPRDRSVSITETVLIVAAGAAEKVPFYEVTNLARTMDQLKSAGIWLVGTSDDADEDLYSVELTGPLGIVMGGEGKGLRRLTAERCDRLVRIPMLGSVECLNVSVAAGVCLFEAVRQRNKLI